MHDEDDTYGKMVPWRIDEAHRMEDFGVPAGAGDLGSSGDDTDLLVGIAKELVGVSPSEGDDKWQVAAERGSREVSTEGKGPLCERLMFSKPPTLELTATANLVKSRCEAAHEMMRRLQNRSRLRSESSCLGDRYRRRTFTRPASSCRHGTAAPNLPFDLSSECQPMECNG